MILDERNEFCDATSLNTGAAGTYNLGDIIPLGVPGDLGISDALYLVIQVDTAIITGGSAGKVGFQLVSDGTSTIATDGSQTVHFRSQDYTTGGTAGLLVPGAVLVVAQLPLETLAPYENFIGVQQVTTTTALTAGKINAFLTPDPAKWKAVAAPWQ